MVPIKNIRSLTEFQRNARKVIREMKKSGQPQVLTINGKAEVVVQDAVSYQKLLDALDRADATMVLRQRVTESRRGKMIPADIVLERIRKKHGIPRSVLRDGGD